MDRTWRWVRRCPSQQSFYSFVAQLLFVLAVLQGCAESASRVQNSKPDFNEITPSPEFSINTDGWRPIVPPSTSPPPKTEEEMRAVMDNQPPKHPKQRVTPNRFPSESKPETLEGLAPPPIDVIIESEKSGDNEAQLRLRRQKKRPHFKTVDPPVLVSSGSEALSFRANSESPFVRHFADAPDSQFRHRPIETNSGAIYRAVHTPLQGTPFRMADPAPSQEMLPPTAPSRLFPSPVESQHFRLRPQQQPLHGSHIIFHGQLPIQQQQQQRFPTVARPSDPLPGSILRPHADRTPLTDSTAFRTGGGQYHYRPAPVQWPNPLNEGRPAYSVTNTPLVDDHPWPSSNHHNGDRRPEVSAVTVFPHHVGSQSIRGSNEGKPQKEASQVTATTVIVPDVPKNPFTSAQKGKIKPQREQNRPQLPLSGTIGGADPIGQIHKQKINPSLRDTSIDLRPNKTPSVEVGIHVSDSNKPQRENIDGKYFDHHGLDNFGNEDNLRPREKQRLETVSSDMNREERPRLPGSSKIRQNPNYRKRTEEPTMNVNAEPANEFSSVPTSTHDKVIPSNQGANTQRGQGFRVRKRRPKPTGQRQEAQSNKPLRTQEISQYQQEVYQQKDHAQPQQEVYQQQFQHQQVYQQHVSQTQKEIIQEQVFQPQQDINPELEAHQLEGPKKQQVLPYQQQENNQSPQEVVTELQEVQRPKVATQRKRLRRPTRIRKPIKEAVIEPSIPKEENYLLPTGQAETSVEEQTQKHKFRESRPRPILRTRRPRPEASPSPLPIQNIATAPDDTSFVQEDLPYERPKKIRVRPSIRYENKDNDNGRDNDQLQSSIAPEPTRSYEEQTHEIDGASGKTQNFKIHEPLFEEEKVKEVTESVPAPVTDVGYQVHESNLDAIDVIAKNPEIAADVSEIEEQKINNPDNTNFPPNADPPETSTSSTTSEAPQLSTTESQTTTVAPTSSAYGIRNRLRAGSRPRFSVKDYRERLNRLSQLSGRGRNSTDSSAEEVDTPSTGSGVGPSAPSRERWYPGRRQQQTLQEQQQLQHQRLQANRNDGEAQGEKSKTESRDRYRLRAPALRQRPSASDSKKIEETASNANGKNDEIYTTTTSRYKSRFGGRYSTTTSGNTDAETTTTESPTSRRRGILTTYGMRRPYPLRLRLGTTTSTESADVQSAAETTTPMTASNEVTTTMNPTTTEPATTTTTSTVAPVSTTAVTTTTSTTTTEIIIPKVVENEVTERNSEDHAVSKEIYANGQTTEVAEVMELKESTHLKDSMLRQDELIKAGEEAPMEDSEEESEELEEDAFNPAQRVSDLTLWATTGNSGGLKTDGSKDKGLVTFSAVPYPSSAFSSRLVTMATEDPVLPLEAFFFRPSSSSNRSEKE